MPKTSSFASRFFLIANIAVAICFLLGCYAKWFPPQRWSFIGLFTLASFYLLVVLLIFFIVWMFVKPGRSLIFIIVLALAFKQVQNIIPFRLSAPFAVQKQKEELRIMSWNVAQFNILDDKKTPGIKKQMLELINKYQPDIACFQEMVAGDSTINLNTPYYRKYRFYPLDSFSGLLHFPYHFYVYNYKEDFFWEQHFGIIIFSKYPLINKQEVANYPYDYNSIFQHADIVKDGDTIRIFNIHLQSLHFSPRNLDYIDSPSLESKQDVQQSENVLSRFKTGFLKRQIQAERVKAEVNKSPYPVVLCGDFNDVPNSYAYATIGNGLQNAFVQKGAGIGRSFSGIAPTLRIDNIFLDERFSVQQFTRIKKKLSDHFPVITDVVLQK